MSQVNNIYGCDITDLLTSDDKKIDDDDDDFKRTLKSLEHAPVDTNHDLTHHGLRTTEVDKEFDAIESKCDKDKPDKELHFYLDPNLMYHRNVGHVHASDDVDMACKKKKGYIQEIFLVKLFKLLQ